jgi:hypothetical protein
MDMDALYLTAFVLASLQSLYLFGTSITEVFGTGVINIYVTSVTILHVLWQLFHAHVWHSAVIYCSYASDNSIADYWHVHHTSST